MEQVKNPVGVKTAVVGQGIFAESDKYNIISAAFVFVTALVVYLMTVAPTIAFWDCGEYTAAGHSLGIPHPPGNPLFVLVMRAASMAFAFFEDVGYRMNFAVVIASALTAMFIYLVVVEAAKMFVGKPDTTEKKITIYVGGIVGGLFAAFGYTFWFSAVETSVYNLSMLYIAICTFLMLRWAQSTRPDRDRLLILVAFLGFSGIGLHMYTMVIFPPAFLFMILWDEKKRKDWRLWMTGLLMATLLYNLSLFIKVGPAVLLTTAIMTFSTNRQVRLGLLIALAAIGSYLLYYMIEPDPATGLRPVTMEYIATIVFAIGAAIALSHTSIEPEQKSKWQLCFFFALFAILGYSVHIFIPIRSALEPMINENHPDNWEALIGFLERTQYGSESMLRRMFWRRGEWATQFGIDGHMGYGGFHITQFFRLGLADREVPLFAAGFTNGMAKLFLYLIPTAFMIWGWVYLYKKNKPAAIFLTSLLLLTTVGMVLYMNFADGTRPERIDFEHWVRQGRPGPMPTVHREVRVRDYFFTAGFMYFGMWIGLATSCLLNALFSAKEAATRKIAPICAMLLAASPVIPAVSNFALSTRAGDWVAYDYAYNMLQSSEPGGIIFTNGDNDTFPLWALQEAYGVRNDVRIVNLSLANTEWYNQQLRKLEPRVPMSFTEEQLSELEPQLNRFRESRPFNMRRAGITVMLPSFDERQVIRVSDRMVLNITDSAMAANRPVYFASTVSEDNYMGLGPFLQNEGLVSRVVRTPPSGRDRVNVDRILGLVDSVFLMRGIGDAVHNETAKRLLINYLQIAVDLRAPLRIAKSDLETVRSIASGEGLDTTDAEVIYRIEEARALLPIVEPRHEEQVAAAIRFMERLVEKMHWDWRARAILSDFLIDHDRGEEAIKLLEEGMRVDRASAMQYELLLEQANMLVEREREQARLRALIEQEETQEQTHEQAQAQGEEE